MYIMGLWRSSVLQRALVGAGTLILGAATLPALPGQEKEERGARYELQERAIGAEKGLVGTWEVNQVPEEGGPPPFLCLFTFASDGTLVESDDGPPTPHLFTAGHGVWAKIGERDHDVVYKQINFDVDANLTGIFKARAKIQLGKDGDTLTGTIKVEFFDANGVLFLTGNGTLSGRRMRLD